MKYLKWTIIAVAVMAGFAIYGEMSRGSSLQFALLEGHPIFLVVLAVLVAVYTVMAGMKMLRR